MFDRIIISPYRFAFLSVCLLATPVSSQNVTSILDPEFVKRFNYADQPGAIQLDDWISLLTLCLAPLIAHILAGVPRTVKLSLRRIRWHEWICIYNPTSILWRYFAIMDRRVRHKSWNAIDMASSNTYFWVDHGWDGSEEILARGRALCTKAPDHHRTAIFSSESFKTIIIAAQGVQAFYALVGGIMAFYGVGNQDYGGLIALDSAFSPLAIVGLLRVFAALWLTDDYSYEPERDAFEMSLRNNSITDLRKSISFVQEGKEQGSLTINCSGLSHTRLEEDFLPQSYWLAILLRMLYLLPFCGLIVMGIFELAPTKEVRKPYSSPATTIQSILYASFLVISVSIFIVYMALGKCTTTVIPCMNSILYKAYTCVLFLMALALLIASAVCTRKAACGKYTTFPEEYDQDICSGTPISSNSQNLPFGMVAYIQGSEHSKNETREIAIVELDGWCSGVLVSNTIVDIVDLQP